MKDKVLLILVDGMRPDALQAAGLPEALTYFRSGSYTWEGQTVYPSITLPCHLSLFGNVSPERHQVPDNIYHELAADQKPLPAGLIESICAAGKKAAMFYSWEELRDINRPGSMEFVWFMRGTDRDWMAVDEKATKACIDYLCAEKPDFAFLYLGAVDDIGHKCGWMSESYLDLVTRETELICQVQEALPEDYHVIITADHGGHDRDHAAGLAEDMTIPVSFIGDAFEAGKMLNEVRILDIAPTILDLLGIEKNPEWEGKSVLV